MRWPWGRLLVRGPSMVPTLRPGDMVVVRWGVPARVGDLVVVHPPGRPELLAVKRAVRQVAGGWWVEGDNPYGSTDSREYGAVPETAVLGRVVWRYWPPRRSDA